MRDIALDSTGDLALSSGKGLQLTSGAGAVRQKLQIRFRFVRGEWFADRRVGVPYFEQVLVKNPALPAVEALLRQVAATCPGVVAIESFKLVYRAATREASLTVRAKVTNGEITEIKDFVLGVT